MKVPDRIAQSCQRSSTPEVQKGSPVPSLKVASHERPLLQERILNKNLEVNIPSVKCKVAILLLLSNASQSALQVVLFLVTRRRKLVADSAFCCDFNPYHCAFSAQTKRAKVKMMGENSSQKSSPGSMSGYVALRDSFAHIRLCKGKYYQKVRREKWINTIRGPFSRTILIIPAGSSLPWEVLVPIRFRVL